MVDKKGFTIEDDGIKEIIDWFNGLTKAEIQQNISIHTPKENRIKVIEKIVDNVSQSLRWENLDVFKAESLLNDSKLRGAQMRITFSETLVEKQKSLNDICEDLDEAPKIVTTKLLVLYKSPECFVETTPENITQFKRRLLEVITTLIDNEIEDRNQEDEVVEEKTTEDETVGEETTEDEAVEEETTEDDQTIEIEWTEEMIQDLQKICNLRDEKPGETISRLINDEVEVVSEKLELFLRDKEQLEILQILYGIDIRTFSQLESLDLVASFESGTLNEEQVEKISGLRESFGLN
tara:strand:+ start:315 stop:1196 length:882 start_codon:yes stop_codon:yes gene_type:complete